MSRRSAISRLTRYWQKAVPDEEWVVGWRHGPCVSAWAWWWSPHSGGDWITGWIRCWRPCYRGPWNESCTAARACAVGRPAECSGLPGLPAAIQSGFCTCSAYRSGAYPGVPDCRQSSCGAWRHPASGWPSGSHLPSARGAGLWRSAAGMYAAVTGAYGYAGLLDPSGRSSGSGAGSPPGTGVATWLGSTAVGDGQRLSADTRRQRNSYQPSAGPAMANQPVA